MKKLLFFLLGIPGMLTAQSLEGIRLVETNGYFSLQASESHSPANLNFRKSNQNWSANGFINLGAGRFLDASKARTYGLSYIHSSSSSESKNYDSLNLVVKSEYFSSNSGHSFTLYRANTWYRPLYKKLGYFYRFYQEAGFGLNSSSNITRIESSEVKYSNPDRFNLQVAGSLHAGLHLRASEKILCTLGFRLIHVGLSYGQYTNSEAGKVVVNRTIQYNISSTLRPSLGIGSANIGVIWLINN